MPRDERYAARRDYIRAWDKKRRDKRIADGICVSCGKNPVTTTRHCPLCKERKRERDRDFGKLRYKAAVHSGVCARCRAPIPEDTKGGKVTCKNCSERVFTTRWGR